VSRCALSRSRAPAGVTGHAQSDANRRPHSQRHRSLLASSTTITRINTQRLFIKKARSFHSLARSRGVIKRLRAALFKSICFKAFISARMEFIKGEKINARGSHLFPEQLRISLYLCKWRLMLWKQIAIFFHYLLRYAGRIIEGF
jgi:hypothetical protein